MNRIKDLRIKFGKSQVELAEMLNINRTTLTKWETGKHNPDLDTIIVLADYFNVSTDYLIGRDAKEKEFDFSEITNELIAAARQNRGSKGGESHNIIRDLRKHKNLTQSELSEQLNVHPSAVSQWETGRTNPDFAQAVQLAEFFKVTVDCIVGREAIPAISDDEMILLELFRLSSRIGQERIIEQAEFMSQKYMSGSVAFSILPENSDSSEIDELSEIYNNLDEDAKNLLLRRVRQIVRMYKNLPRASVEDNDEGIASMDA